MIFAYIDDAVVLPINAAIGVAHGNGRGKRLWLTTGYMTVEALVEKIGEVYDTFTDHEGSAPIFVNTGAYIKRWRCYVGDNAIGSMTDKSCTAPFRWAGFYPVEVLPVEQDFT